MAFNCGPTNVQKQPGSPLMMNYTNSDHHGGRIPSNNPSSSSHPRRRSISSRHHRDDEDDDDYDDRRDDSIFYDDDDDDDNKNTKKSDQQRRSHPNRSMTSGGNRNGSSDRGPYEDDSNIAIMMSNTSIKDKHHHNSTNIGAVHSNPTSDDSLLEVDYDLGATILYRYIENKQWDYASQRLIEAPDDAKTWVSRKDITATSSVNKTRWKLLPIHAVCIFRAPLQFMEQLIHAFPDGTKMKDDQGMLPIHLACRNGASLNVIMLLLKSYPISIYIRDRKQRTIHDLITMNNTNNTTSSSGALSPNKSKENLLNAIQQFQDDIENGIIDMNNNKTSSKNHNKTTKVDDYVMNQENNNHDSIKSTGSSSKRRKSLSTSSKNPTTSTALKESRSHTSGNKKEELYVDINTNAMTPNTQYSAPILPLSSSPGIAPPLVSSSMIMEQPKSLLMQHVGGSNGNTMMTPSLIASNPTQLMMDMYNEIEVDYDHRTTLFRLLLKKDWDNVIKRCSEYPNEVSTWIVTKGFNGSLRFLPIHKACVLQPPLTVIQALLQAYPMGCMKTDQDGWLPIHCAGFYGASSLILNELIQFFPKGCQWKDCDGRLPLHYACLKGADVMIVDKLIQTYARGVMIKDSEGRLPIHHACSKGAAYEIIDLLIKSNPKCTQMKDDQGRLPLHHSCRKIHPSTDSKSDGSSSNHHQLRTIKLLLKTYPRAAQIKDDQEKLPIHFICQPHHPVSSSKTTNDGITNSNDTTLKDIVSCLLSTYPESVNVENGFGYTPYDEACMTAKTYKSNKTNDAEANKVQYEKWWNDIVTILQKYRKEQQETAPTTTTKMMTVADKKYHRKLEDRIETLERHLSQYEINVITYMNMIGTEMKLSLRELSSSAATSNKKGDENDATRNIINVLEKLSNKFHEFEIDSSATKTTKTAVGATSKREVATDKNSSKLRKDPSTSRHRERSMSVSSRRRSGHHRSLSNDSRGNNDSPRQHGKDESTTKTPATTGGGTATTSKTPTRSRSSGKPTTPTRNPTTPIRNLFNRNKK